MAATYDELLPTNRDRARYLLGDTDVSNALRTDEHYDAVLAQHSSFEAAVKFIAEGLITEFAQQPDTVRLVSGLSISFKERIDAWEGLIRRLDAAISQQADVIAHHAYGTDGVRTIVEW